MKKLLSYTHCHSFPIKVVVMFEITPRAFDGKFVLWRNIEDPGYRPDREYFAKAGLKMPRKWVVLGVFDTQVAAEHARGVY